MIRWLQSACWSFAGNRFERLYRDIARVEHGGEYRTVRQVPAGEDACWNARPSLGPPNAVCRRQRQRINARVERRPAHYLIQASGKCFGREIVLQGGASGFLGAMQKSAGAADQLYRVTRLGNN